MCRSIGRRGIVAALGLSLFAGSATFDLASMNTVEAGEPGAVRTYLSNALQKLKGRSAKERYQQYRADDAQTPSSASAETAEPRRLSAGAQGGSGAPLLPQEPSEFVLVSKDEGEGATAAEPVAEAVEPLPPAVPGGVDIVESAYQAEGDPRNLKSIRDIQPFHDYQPGTHVEQDLDPQFVAPAEIELGEVTDGVRSNEAILFQWHASNLHHYPLYFEDPGLERYGHVHHDLVQPFVSVGRFGLQLVGLPYQMSIDPVCKKRYALGWYRPGECAPKQTEQIPWNSTAALNQAAAVTGLWFAIP